MYQPQYQREKSRDRSRDRERKSYGRSPSEDQNNYDRKFKSKDNKIRAKRVKPYCRFEENDDIKVFRKEDEPCAKGLAEEQILKIKTEIQKQIAKSYDFNWQHYKHRDALSESNSMKEQKEKQKALCQKLMSAKQSIAYFYPPLLVNIDKIIEVGQDSVEREGHTARIHDILGCYYTHVSQIPNQPQFQILNTNTSSESKLIKFDNDLFCDDNNFGNNNKKSVENTKPLKGILKMPNDIKVDRTKSEPRSIDPQLIYLLKDFKQNPNMYTKQKTDLLLKPYRDSGQLEFLMKNKEVLQAMVRTTSMPNPVQAPRPTYSMNMPSMNKESNQRSGSSQPPNMPMPGNYNPNFVPKADKFRTVPCKYFHSPQGCSKIDNCTFIHDQKYAGQLVPNSQPMSQGFSQMPQNRVSNYNPTMYGGYPPSNMGHMQQMGGMPPNIQGNQGYYGGPPSVYPSNTGHYYQNSNPNPNSVNQGYPPYNINSAPPQYIPPGHQYGMTGPPPQHSSQHMPQQQGYGNHNYQYYLGKNQNYPNK